MSSENVLLLALAVVLFGTTTLRFIAPPIVTRYKGRWPDTLITALLKGGNDVVGMMLALLKGQTTASPTLEVDQETRLAMAKAIYEAKERAKAALNGDAPESARKWEDLDAIGKGAYLAGVDRGVPK